MASDFIGLDSIDELERLIAESDQRLIVVFKHSVTCGISAVAYDELRALVSDAPSAAKYAIVTVQTHRDVSNAVSTRFDVRHETPQALLIHKGCVVWEGSHFRLTAETLQTAIENYSSTDES